MFMYYYGQCDGLAGIRTQSAKKACENVMIYSLKDDALDELCSLDVTPRLPGQVNERSVITASTVA